MPNLFQKTYRQECECDTISASCSSDNKANRIFIWLVMAKSKSFNGLNWKNKPLLVGKHKFLTLNLWIDQGRWLEKY
uniref:Uncharacterized protein n=1 Tax=Romanomermis culicivorax TaxID=13658 RepID=A0A915J6R1_ROMCU